MTKHIIGLDSLRAIASMAVVICHIELSKYYYSAYKSSYIITPNEAHIGVVLFFVISGYLITTLLFKEKEKSKTISIKKFYLRRIFRIWPLYYFIILFSALLLNYTPKELTLIYCLTILPNIAEITGYSWAVSPQIWSIGVEEQFYLIWPYFVKFIKNKLLLILIIFFIIGWTLLPHALLFIINHTSNSSENLKILITKFFHGAKFNCMAMGALLAYTDNFYSKLLHFFRLKYASYFFIILPFVFWFGDFEISYFTDEVLALLFCILIAIITHKSYIIFNNEIVNYIGKISYGIYMYHWVLILCYYKFIFPFHLNSSAALFNLYLYFFVIVSTIGISTLSFYTFERYFSNMKIKFN